MCQVAGSGEPIEISVMGDQLCSKHTENDVVPTRVVKVSIKETPGRAFLKRRWRLTTS